MNLRQSKRQAYKTAKKLYEMEFMYKYPFSLGLCVFKHDILSRNQRDEWHFTIYSILSDCLQLIAPTMQDAQKYNHPFGPWSYWGKPNNAPPTSAKAIKCRIDLATLYMELLKEKLLS